MIDPVNIYHALPYQMRSAAASLYGFHLRSWRYGPETEHLIEEALDRDRWSLSQWHDWEDERLSYILHRAAMKVPYYKDYWQKRRRHGDRASWELLINWPILKKQTLRENPLALIADDCNVSLMYRDRTGGTTGTPLSIYLSRPSMRQWYALFEARIRRWHGVSINEHWAILGGQLVVPVNQSKPPFWVHNLGLNQLYLSSQHVSMHNAQWFAKVLNRFSPTHMIVYPSSAVVLAYAALEMKLVLPPINVIFSNAETLLPSHRDVIAKAFGCSVRNTYGMGEYVCGASECQEGLMHLWPEVGKIEIFDDIIDHPLPKRSPGRIILTGLLNPDMPLIRYDVGDRGELKSDKGLCICQRSLPILFDIQGRSNDMLITPDGRYVFWLNPVFYELPIIEAQIVQTKVDDVQINYVPALGYDNDMDQIIIKRMLERMGNIHIRLHRVDHIPRAANGKFRAVISNLKQRNL